jgi:hypothetical protein
MPRNLDLLRRILSGFHFLGVVIECYTGRCGSGRPRGVEYCEVSDG